MVGMLTYTAEFANSEACLTGEIGDRTGDLTK